MQSFKCTAMTDMFLTIMNGIYKQGQATLIALRAKHKSCTSYEDSLYYNFVHVFIYIYTVVFFLVSAIFDLVNK